MSVSTLSRCAMVVGRLVLPLAIVAVLVAPMQALAADDQAFADLQAQLAAQQTFLDTALQENEALAAANERLTIANEVLREQNAKRGWVQVRRLRAQIVGLRMQMRRLQPRFQTNAQRWSMVTNLYAFMEEGCVDGWDYNSSTSSSGSYDYYSFSRWTSC